jgi:hypothetical protein
LRTIIGIAAPARSGKDTVAAMLLKHGNVAAYALADPVKMGCQVLFGLTDQEAWVDDYKEKKIALWDRSPREFFQCIGTDWMRQYNPNHWLLRADREINPSRSSFTALCPARLEHPAAPFRLAAQAFFDLSDRQTWDETYIDINDAFWSLSPRQMFELVETLALKDFPNFKSQRVQRPIAAPMKKTLNVSDEGVIVIKDIRFENEADYLRRHNGQIWHVLRRDIEKVNPHSSELGIKIQDNDIVIDNNGSLEQLATAVETQWGKIATTQLESQ